MRGRRWPARRPGVVGQLDVALLHRPVRQDHDQQRHARAEAHELHGPDRGRLVAGAHHHGGIVGEAGQQPARAPEQVLHLAVDVGEEIAHLVALVRPEAPRAPRWSTKNRYPLSVGIRPALVCGWTR